MAAKRTSLSGRAGAVTGGDSRAGARDNTKEAKFWVSHRGGPFLVHKVGDCEPQPNDNAGYLDIFDTAIDQGFAPCPKCMNKS